MPVDKISVGDVEIVALLDLTMQFPWELPFPQNSQVDFEPYRELYPDAFGEGKFRTNAQCYAIRAGGKTLLCDTGVGPGPIAWLGGASGRLLDDMREKGIDPESVDIVVHTHLHADHVGWNVTSRAATFLNARYYVPQGDWDEFRKAPAANPQLQQVTPLLEMGKVELFSGETSLTAEVTTLPTPGHTPGHSSLLVSSGGERALIMGDLAHHPAQIDRPEWMCGFDSDGRLGVETRRRMLDRAEREDSPVAFCHFPHPGFGKIARLQGRRVFQAL